MLVRVGKGGKRRTVGIDDWAWEHVARWTEQLGHAHLGITSIYLQGIDTREIIDTVRHRRPPVIPASAGLRP